MNLLVFYEVGLENESFPTLGALIGLLSSVRHHVSTEIEQYDSKRLSHRLCVQRVFIWCESYDDCKVSVGRRPFHIYCMHGASLQCVEYSCVDTN